jgi:cyanophycin synthetase
MVAEDIGQPIRGGLGAVIEVNAAPGIRMHHYPSAGKPRDVAARLSSTFSPAATDGFRLWRLPARTARLR